VSADIADNASAIRHQMRHARRLYADLVHFSETALSGYAKVDHKSLENLDWNLLRTETESICALANELDVWVILGTTHRLGDGLKPHNSLYVINPEGKITDRYDKRFCTGGDLEHYSPGDHFVVFEINGVKCGLLICYDIRFPELYREYHKLGVQVMFHSFYNARQKPGAIHPMIMPVSAQTRAATNYMFVCLTNSCASRSWPGHFITPEGRIADKLPLDQPAVSVNLVDTTKKFYDASRPYRMDAIKGKLNSGQAIDAPRSEDRTCY
jgi:predicted amidohydrolase